MNSVCEIIDGLGGNAAVSRELGLKPSAVSEMKRRGSIGPRYWPQLIALAEKVGVAGVSADTLMRMHAAGFSGVHDNDDAETATSCLGNSAMDVSHAVSRGAA